MDTGVYANNREICSKASDGASTAAFPDPCWTPPTPPVVVPYPNTAKAGTLDNGSTTVFIKNTMIAKEDESFFASSTGDEGGTQGQPKGVATGALQGKAYFQSWSQNVKVEGLCVARHQDLMTHNHGSFPSNTPMFPYISRGFFGGHSCKDEEKKIERACKPEKDDSDTRREIKKNSKLYNFLKKLKRKKVDKNDKSNKKKWHWTDDHCDGLDIPIDSKNAQEYYDEVKEGLEKLPDELNILNALENELKDMAINAGTKATLKWGAKLGAKQLAGSSLPVIGNAAMAIWSVADGISAIGDVSEIKAVAEESLEQLKVLKDKLTDMQKLADRMKNATTEDIHDLAADGQDMLATLNACTRARKCNLVPFDTVNSITGARGSKVESASGGGCCNGQTGHHLLNNKMIEDTCPGWTKVQGNLAPTVCVEGVSWHKGSHGRVHKAMATILEEMQKGSDGLISLEQAKHAAVMSHIAAFPYAGCSYLCIKEQLDEFYKICKGSRAKPVNEYGKETSNTNNDGIEE